VNSIRSPLLSLAFGLVASTVQAADPPGMVWVPGGEFVIGTDDKKSMPNERPAHRVYVDGFWMDATIVTNAEFGQFVAATSYKTVAERPVDWEELKKQVPPGTPGRRTKCCNQAPWSSRRPITPWTCAT